MTAIDKIVPYLNKRIKVNTQKWLDSEVLEKLNARDKIFKMLNAKYDASKLITASKKQAFFKEKLSETISKPKEL